MGNLVYFLIGVLVGGVLGILLMCLIIAGASVESPKDLTRRKR